jgi:5-methyltetrahydrofolate--homocysteine methyltransferase
MFHSHLEEMIQFGKHSVFLYHAIQNGMMGIVNPEMLSIYDENSKRFLEHVEDVNSEPTNDATERLLDFAENVKCKSNEKNQEWRSGTIQERLTHSLVRGG